MEERFNRLVDRLGKDKFNAIVEKVLSKKLEGPTVEEYFTLAGEYSVFSFANIPSAVTEVFDDIESLETINKSFIGSINCERSSIFNSTPCLNEMEWLEIECEICEVA